MAACFSQEDSGGPDKSSNSACSKQLSRSAVDKVASWDEKGLRNLLDDLIDSTKSKKEKSQEVQLLLEEAEDQEANEDRLVRESLSLLNKKRKKKYRDSYGTVYTSVASSTNTGGSLGSLQDLTKVATPQKGSTAKGIAAKSRAGGSCGNLSRGSFPTLSPSCHTGRRGNRKEKRVSSSQHEGGSLQNLAETEIEYIEAAQLQKSPSLSHFFCEGQSIHRKIRQKSPSESSAGYISTSQPSEEREELSDDSNEDGTREYNYRVLQTSLPEYSSLPVPSDSGLCETTVSFDQALKSHHTFGSIASGATVCSTTDSSLSCNYHQQHQALQLCSSNSEETTDSDMSRTSVEVDASIPLFNESRKKLYVVQNGRKSPRLSFPSDCKDLYNLHFSFKLFEKQFTPSIANKNTLDENGNPIAILNGIGTVSEQFLSDRHVFSSNSRRNLYTSSQRENSTYAKLKAKKDKKNASREKDVVLTDNIDGYQGNKPLEDILKDLGEDDNTTKGKRKRRKEEGKTDEMEKRKTRVGEEKCSKEDSKNDADSDPGISCGGELRVKKSGSHSCRVKRSKMSGLLRESTSMEDLVSKSKQDDDNVERISKPVNEENINVKVNGFAFQVNEMKNEFNTIVQRDLSPPPAYGGDFELVSRKKGKRSKLPILSNDATQKLSAVPVVQNYSGTGEQVRDDCFKGGGWRNSCTQSRFYRNGIKRNYNGHSSDDSESDGEVSIHSMPDNSTMHKSKNLKYIESSSQASYANIARLSHVGNRPKVDATSASYLQTGHSPINKAESLDESVMLDALESHSHKEESNFDDDCFPALLETFNSGLTFLCLKVSDSNCQKNNEIKDGVSKGSAVKVPSDTKEQKLFTNGNNNLVNKISNSSVCGSFEKTYSRNNNCDKKQDSIADERAATKLYTSQRSSSVVPNGPTKSKESPPFHKSTKNSNIELTEPVVFADNTELSNSTENMGFSFIFDCSHCSLLNGLPEIMEDNISACENNNVIPSEPTEYDFCKLFKAPEKDEFNYNYDELLKHFSSAWEKTLQELERDPKNMQYWKAESV